MKNFVLATLAFGFLLTTSSAFAKSGGSIKMVPGKSLGSVNLGDDRQKLIDHGFAPDGAMDPISYLQKNGILAHLDDDKVVQIYVDQKSFGKLVIRGKKLPKDTKAKSLTKFFKSCGKPKKGSGGTVIYCENHGIELSYSRDRSNKGKLVGVAVVSSKAEKASTSKKSSKKAAAPAKKSKSKVKSQPVVESQDDPIVEPKAPKAKKAKPEAKPETQPEAQPDINEENFEQSLDAPTPPPAGDAASIPAPPAENSATPAPEEKSDEKSDEQKLDDDPFQD